MRRRQPLTRASRAPLGDPHPVQLDQLDPIPDMPIPQPSAGEGADDFHSRCMSAIWEEYKDKDNGAAQANAICYSVYREHVKKATMSSGPKRLYGVIEKVEEVGDGTVKVHGIASTEAEDDQGEIVRADAMRDAIPDYMKFGAVREMHGLSAAGRALECNCGNDNVTRIVAHVVDPTAVLKVKNRVYNGFSIGGQVTQRESGNYKTITALKLHEISLVDRPANPQATIDLWKSGDTVMPDGLSTIGDAFAQAMAKTQQFWRCNNPKHMHFRKEDAANCMAKSAAAAAALVESRKRIDDGDPRFGDTTKHGMPSGPAIKPDEPPGVDNSEANFDGDADDDDEEESAETAGGEFRPESDANRADDFGKKKAAGKPKGDYGKVRYADPGYQDDKKPRYPIDNEGHVRAAWSYINMPKNARLYSSEQLGRVKSAIRAAAKKYGIEISEKAIFDLGDPDALIKALASASIGELLDELPYDAGMVIEKAGRRQSGADAFLKNVVHDAIGKLTDDQFCMKASGNATQDTAGNAEHAAPNQGTDSGTPHYTGGNSAQDTSKRGMRHSAATMKYLKKAHDNICEAGAYCPGRDMQKVSTAEESAMSANPTTTSDEGSDATTKALAKALKKRNKKLEKAVATMSQQMQSMQVRMEYMAKEAGTPPPPPPPVPEKEPKLKKQMSAIVETLAAMGQKVEQIAATPIPGGASHLPPGIVDVTKAQDGRMGAPPQQQMAAAEELAKKWQEMSPDERFAASYALSRMRPYAQQR
jgi:hypothetical protein